MMPSNLGLTRGAILACVGVVFLLIIVLFPRPERHDAAGAPVTCPELMKQVALGLKQYTHDYDDRFPLLDAANLAPTAPPCTGYMASLQPYLKSVEVFRCPVVTNHVSGLTDYGYNSRVVAGGTERSFKHAANSVLLCEIPDTEGSLASASAPLITDRHGNGSNYAFVDGHVKWLESTKAPSPSNTPAASDNFTFGS